LILYGSVQKDTANKASDVDVAIVVARAVDVKRVEEIFNSVIAQRFNLILVFIWIVM
jgi:predicted nucleotidyltransferase